MIASEKSTVFSRESGFKKGQLAAHLRGKLNYVKDGGFIFAVGTELHVTKDKYWDLIK